MQEHLPYNIFEIKLDETGINYIRKFYRLSATIYILLILVSSFSIYMDISSFLAIRRAIETGSLITGGMRGYTFYLVRPLLYAAIMMGNIWSGYHYFKFARMLNKSIDTDNPPVFNLSFKHLFYNAAVFTGFLALTVLLDLLILFSSPDPFL